MWEFWTRLLDPTGFPPRWSCGVWSPGLGWLHILSDLAIWAAYFAIPCVLGFYALRRKDLPFRTVHLLFIAFILACGLTHLMEAVIFWWPAYRLAGLLKVLTAAASWATVVALVGVTPRLLAFRSPAELEREIAERKRAESDLRALHAQLELRVAERTAELRESEERFRRAFADAPIGMALVSPDGQFLRVNGSLCDLLGYSAAELLATGPQHITHPADRDADQAQVRELLTGFRSTYEIEKRYLHKDGGVVHTILSVSVVRDSAGVPLYAIKQIQDITERKRTEQRLAVASGRLNAILNAVPVGVSFSDDATCQRITGNPAVQAQFGGRPTDNLSASADDPSAPGRRVQFFQNGRPITDAELPLQRAVAENRVIPPMELVVVLPDGRTWFAEASGAPVHDDRGAVIAGVALTVDVTARKQAEADLQASEERFRGAFEHTGVAMGLTDTGNRFVRVNTAFAALFGYPPDEIVGKTMAAVTHPDDVAAGDAEREHLRAGTRPYFQIEARYVRSDGHLFWGLTNVSVVRAAGGEPQLYVAQVQDVTERKRAEERLTASLREKEVLLKEIHHRVKNNLQIVSALLDLQSRRTTDPAAVEMFRESRGRVKSMALIHERLYRAQDLARVDFAVYTRQLARDLFLTYKVTGDIRLELDVDIPSLPIDIAIPCGLLLNELISNSLKHAFAAAAAGCVRVALRRDETANVLTVADDGVGFPAGLDVRAATSFGLRLVNTLVEQLGGECSMMSERGSTFTVRFPLCPPAPVTGALP